MQTSPFCSLAPFPEKKKPLFDLAIHSNWWRTKTWCSLWRAEMRTEHGEYQRLSVNGWGLWANCSAIQMEGKGEEAGIGSVTRQDWKGQQTVLLPSNKDVCSKPIDPLHAFLGRRQPVSLETLPALELGALPAAPSLPHKASQIASTSLPAFSSLPVSSLIHDHLTHHSRSVEMSPLLRNSLPAFFDNEFFLPLSSATLCTVLHIITPLSLVLLFTYLSLPLH